LNKVVEKEQTLVHLQKLIESRKSILCINSISASFASMKTIVIVGGGMAGLSAAVDLCDPAKYPAGASRPKVVIFESLPKLGGNIRSTPLEVKQDTMYGESNTVQASYDGGALQIFRLFGER
jgi:heterodisulfide reductase subunit A-like polyferredoxin